MMIGPLTLECGLQYIYYNSEYWLNLRGLWANWPQRELTGLVKGYVLAQWAFWLQQILVIYMEERRKDHYQMLTHHIITIGLLSSCYFYHHTRVGNLVLVLMDVVDIFLPVRCLLILLRLGSRIMLSFRETKALLTSNLCSSSPSASSTLATRRYATLSSVCSWSLGFSPATSST